MPTSTAGFKGYVNLGGTVWRVFRYTVTVSAPEEPLPIVPSSGRPTEGGSAFFRRIIPPAPSQIIEQDIWASGYVLGPPRFEVTLECFFHPDDNPFNITAAGRKAFRVGSVCGLNILPDIDDGRLGWTTYLLISKIEMTQGVRTPSTYNLTGVGLRYATYPYNDGV